MFSSLCIVLLSFSPHFITICLPCSHHYIVLLSFSPHFITISVFHVLITTSCSVFLSTCPNHLSLPCSHHYIVLLSFSPHFITISVFHVLITMYSALVFFSTFHNHLSSMFSSLHSALVFFSTFHNHLSLPCSHNYILLCLSLHMSQPSQSSMFSSLHSALVFFSTFHNHLSLPCSHHYIVLLSFSPHFITISVFHVLITMYSSSLFPTATYKKVNTSL